MYENLKDTIQKIKKIVKGSIDKKLNDMGFLKDEKLFKKKFVKKDDEMYNMLFEMFSDNYEVQREKYIENYTFNYLNKILALKILIEKNIINKNRNIFELKKYIPELFDDIYNIDIDKEVNENIFNEINNVKHWKKEDILGWAYQYYNLDENRPKLFEQSQFYTPEWIVEYLVDNTLTKYYCEIYDDVEIANKYKIIYEKRDTEKKLEEFKIIDPACGSGHFLIKVYDRLKEFYERQGYNKKEYIKSIIEKNIYGMDIDERAIEIAKIILKIKALEDGYENDFNFNLVSTNFEMINSEDIEDIELKNVYNVVKEDLEGYKILGSLIVLSNKSKRKILSLQNRNTIPMFEEKTHLERYYLEKIKKFFKILVNKYDIVISNPPYTDSHDYTPELRKFIREKYFDFRKNLYATFIKRNYEFLIEDGLLGMITPQTFMFISSYEELRKFIIKNMYIENLVHFGLGGVFEDAMVDTAMYVFRKTKDNVNKGIYIDLNEIPYNNKKTVLFESIKKIYNGEKSQYIFEESQKEFTKIPRSPFVYWINDEIKKIFEYDKLIKFADVRQGIATGDNKRFLRYHWQVPKEEISFNHKVDNKKWVPYAKGGPYNKWFGNLWWVIAFDDENYNILKNMGNHLPNKKYYFKSGITYSMTTSKGPTFRILPENFLFDCKGSSIFTDDENFKFALLGFLNSKLAFYLYKFIAGSVDLEVGDLKHLPISNKLIKDSKKRKLLIKLVKTIILIKKQNIDISPLELHYKGSPLHQFKNGEIKERLYNIIISKDILDTYILLIEALIEKIIFQIYKLKNNVIKDIFNSEGIPVGWMTVIKDDKIQSLKNLLKTEYLEEFSISKNDVEEIESEVYKFLGYLKHENKILNKEDIKKLYYKKNRNAYDNAIERASYAGNANPINIFNTLKNDIIFSKNYRVNRILFLAINEEYIKNKGSYNKIKIELEEIGLNENIIKKYLKISLKEYLENKFLKEQYSYYKNTYPYI